MNDYQSFLKKKEVTAVPVGIKPPELSSLLFDFQKDIVRWALKRGRHRCDLYYTILGEEVGEVGKAICEYIILKEGTISHLRTELIQVAAVAVAMVESLDRNGV